MIEIRELAPGQLAEAADFAAQQFGCDISAAQPKLYGPRAAGSTYGAFIQGKMAGMLSVYGMTYRSLRWLSVGSVCCAPLYRGRGVMRALFSFLEREVYPQYDAVSLLGQRRLYERFGFAKVYPFLEYAFCFPAQQTECGVERLDRGCRDNDLFTLYQQYGKGPSRSPALFFETAATNGHAVYWLEEHGRAAYAASRTIGYAPPDGLGKDLNIPPRQLMRDKLQYSMEGICCQLAISNFDMYPSPWSWRG